jgi:SNF2 family DNA or RNA helicase
MDGLTSWAVEGSYVTRTCPKGERVAVPAIEFWEARKNDFESNLGIPIASVGHLGLKVGEETKQLTLTVECDEIQQNLGPEVGIPEDHIVINDYWIPISIEESTRYKNFLSENQLQLGDTVDFKSYLSLIRGKNQNLIKVQIASGNNFLETAIKVEPRESGLALEPYKYQKIGIEWLSALRKFGVGGILGDEMGLGKTVQLLGLINLEFLNHSASRVLIIVPSSLKLNWLSEFQKFTPHLEVFVHGGRFRDSMASKIGSHPIVLTTYEILFRDELILQQIDWDLIVCDEAHGMKNPEARRRKSISGFKNSPIFLSTGTPVENNLLDLWSLIDLIRPGLMGSRAQLKNAIEDQMGEASIIGEMVRPLILRRLVGNVLPDLPGVVEKTHWIEPSKEFVAGYESIRDDGLSSDTNKIRLEVIGKLRQYCAYPPLVTQFTTGYSDQKIDLLEKIIDKIQIQDEKVIVFTSWHASADLLQALVNRDYPGFFSAVIDGRDVADDRFSIIETFKKTQGFAVLICNTRAAGEGLNITAANHIIHFDRQWNPAKELQANARAHRIGQEKIVFIHKLIYKGTIEEVIDDRLLLKAHLANETLAPAELEADKKSLSEALQVVPKYTDEGE